MKDIAKSQAPQTPSSSGQAKVFCFVPSNYNEAWKLAEIIAASDFAPRNYKNKPTDVFVAAQMGAMIGLPAMQAVQNIAVINGKPSIYGDAAIAIVLNHHSCEYVNEEIIETSEGLTAVCKVKRKGHPECSYTFSVKDAKTARLWNKTGPWTDYPKRMLQMRARGFALRDKFADALLGMILSEEAADYEVVSENNPVTPYAPGTEKYNSKAEQLAEMLGSADQSPGDVEDVEHFSEGDDSNKLLKSAMLTRLIYEKNISEDIVNKWKEKAGVTKFEEMDEDKLDACINKLKENDAQPRAQTETTTKA